MSKFEEITKINVNEKTEPRKTFNSIGKALGYIEAALKLLEV